MTVAYEKLKLGSLELNDSNPWTLESLDFTPAKKKLQWASNPNADGDALVQEAHYENAKFVLQLRCEKQASIVVALEKVGELLAALQLCERLDGGQALEWTPATTETAYTWYALTAEVEEVPITPSGDLAGWFIASPVLKVSLTCRPFGYTAKRTVLVATESGAEPLQTAYLEGINGDVSAEGELIFTDKASQNRRFVEWGLETLPSKVGNPALLLTAANLTVSGMAGESTTRTGAYSEEKVKRLKTSTISVAFCGTGVIKNIGAYRLKARIYAASTMVRIQATYRTGTGPLIALDWKTPPVAGEWCDVDLGEVTFEEVEQGEQRSEVILNGKTIGTQGEALDLNYLTFVPTSAGHGVARCPLSLGVPSTFKGYDEFNQGGGGTLSGKVAVLGGTWSEAGHAGSFNVDSTNHYVTRATVSDPEGEGRVGILGTSEYTDSVVGTDIFVPTNTLGAGYYGIVARYVSITKGFYAYVSDDSLEGAFWAVASGGFFGNRIAAGSMPFDIHNQTLQLRLVALATGGWYFFANGTLLGSGYSAKLAAGGELANGKIGIYDEFLSSNALTRRYDNFVAWIPEIRPVTYSGRKTEFNTDQAEFSDSSGSYWGPVPFYRGGRFYVPCSGDENWVSRLAVRARRNDTEAESDSPVTDKGAIEVLVRERHLAPV